MKKQILLKTFLMLFIVGFFMVRFFDKNEDVSFKKEKLMASVCYSDTSGAWRPCSGTEFPELINPLISIGQPTLTPTLLKCQKNSDCVLVETACCSCREGGSVDSVKAINKDLLDYFMTRMSVFCPEITEYCRSGEYNCLKKLYPTPVCKDNMCEAVDYQRDDDDRKAIKDYSSDDLSNDIKLSCDVLSRRVEIDDKLGFWNVKMTASIGNNKGCKEFVYLWHGERKQNFWEEQTLLDSSKKELKFERQIKALCASDYKIYGTAICKKTLDVKNPSNIDELMPLKKQYRCANGSCVETVYGGTTLDLCKKSCKDWNSGVWRCVNGKCIDDSRGLYAGNMFLSEKECNSWCFDGPS